MSGQVVRYGIIGASGIAQRRVMPAFRAATKSSLTAICSRSLDTARRLAEPHAAFACDELEQMLDHVDAVYVASPVHCHLDHARRVLQAGKHLLLEKPLARSAEEGLEIVTLARDSGVLAMEAYMMKFHPAHAAIHAAVRDGRLGRVVYARARLGCWYPDLADAWRQDPKLSGGGALMDLGSHLIDLLSWIAGPISSLHAITNTQLFSYKADDSATLVLRFSSGAHGVVESYFSFPDQVGGGILEIVGTEGRILATDTIGQAGAGSVTWQFFPAQAGYAAQQDNPPATQEKRDDFPGCDLYAAQLDYFSTAILNNTLPEINRLEDGLTTLRWIEQAYSR